MPDRGRNLLNCVIISLPVKGRKRGLNVLLTTFAITPHPQCQKP